MLARMTAAVALLLATAIVVAPAAASAQAEPAALTDATVVERDGAVEVWVRLTRAPRYQAELMDGPFRLVLDFEDTAYRWSRAPVAVTPEPVRELRGSQFRQGVARLVIELRRRTAYTIERDREGLRIIFPRETAAREEPPRARVPPPPPPTRPAPAGPFVYGIVMLDEVAHAYIFDPTVRQVRRYRVGDAVGDAVVETIGERHVVLRTPSGRLELRVDETKPRAIAPAPSPR
jgi:hypothetical protein